MNLSWIPVSERLPEKNMACLVAVGKFNFTQMAMYSDLMGTIDHRIFYQGDYGYENFVDITQYVIAWMPLPEPYKEGEDMTEEQYKQLTDIPKSKTETEQAELIKYIKQYCMRTYEYIRLRDPEIEAENVINILNHIISMINDNT